MAKLSLAHPDILIVGGGPAGLSTALHLARQAPELTSRILVLEKAHYPRPKLCGGALLPDAEIILQGLGLDASEVPHVDAAQAHLDFAGKGLSVSLPGGHTLRLVRRDEFDAWLAGKVRDTGIEVRQDVNVKNITPGPDDVTLETDSGIFKAQLVVGADGSTGVTRRCILPGSSVNTARLLEVLTPEAEASPTPGSGAHDRVHGKDIAYFEFLPVPQGIAGYTWDFPTQVDGRPMRCWGVYDTNLLAEMHRPALKTPLADEMARHGYDLAGLELQGHPIRWFGGSEELSGPRVILVGDAAGVDGIFGEGISFALGYGKVAAEAICAALASGDFSFADYRRRVLSSPLGRALLTRSRITRILYRLHWAWFQKLFWQALRSIVLFIALRTVLNWGNRLVQANSDPIPPP